MWSLVKLPSRWPSLLRLRHCLLYFLCFAAVYSRSDTRGSSHQADNIWKYICGGFTTLEHHWILAVPQILHQASHRQQQLGKTELWGRSWCGGERLIWTEAVMFSGSRGSEGLQGPGVCVWPDTPDRLRVPNENVSLGRDTGPRLLKQLSHLSKVPLQPMEPFNGGEEPWKRQARHTQSKTWYVTVMWEFEIFYKPSSLSLGPSQQLHVWRIFRNLGADKLWNVTVLWKVVCHGFYEWNQTE